MKQSIMVPMWLNMSPGKVASQCCHAVASARGTMEDKRVILRLTTPVEMKLVRLLALHAGLMWYSFTDSAPTTEGTDGKETVYWIGGDEETVNSVTGELELY